MNFQFSSNFKGFVPNRRKFETGNHFIFIHSTVYQIIDGIRFNSLGRTTSHTGNVHIFWICLSAIVWEQRQFVCRQWQEKSRNNRRVFNAQMSDITFMAEKFALWNGVHALQIISWAIMTGERVRLRWNFSLAFDNNGFSWAGPEHELYECD